MTTLATTSRLPVETINSHHTGVEFGVIHLDDSDSQLSISECMEVLAEEGWTSREEVPCAQYGVRKFLVSRKK